MAVLNRSAETGERLWSVYADAPTQQLREQLIRQYTPLAYSVLKRVRRWHDEDMEQVALMGLVKAVDRFDPETGNRFTSFAVPTIMGELKRYLRDHSRFIRPPRSLLDLHGAVLTRSRELARELRREPTLEELAASLGTEANLVAEAIASDEVCHPYSLDGFTQSSDREQPASLEECLGGDDPQLERAEARVAWGQALEQLDAPLREVIELRYYENLTQRETARRLGVSQMRVCRMERRALDRLRHRFAVA